LFRKRVDVHFEDHIRQTNTIFQQNDMLLKVTVGGMYSNHSPLKEQQ